MDFLHMGTANYNHLRQWLPYQVMKRSTLSLEQFAIRVRVGRSTLYGYLNDLIRPSEQVMARICRELHVPLEEGLRQYTPRTAGRPKGSGRTKAVTVRQR
jgi:transcriptional regulator with XRE-family HTH domain